MELILFMVANKVLHFRCVTETPCGQHTSVLTIAEPHSGWGGQGAGSRHSRTAGPNQPEGYSPPQNVKLCNLSSRKGGWGCEEAYGGVAPATSWTSCSVCSFLAPRTGKKTGKANVTKPVCQDKDSLVSEGWGRTSVIEKQSFITPRKQTDAQTVWATPTLEDETSPPFFIAEHYLFGQLASLENRESLNTVQALLTKNQNTGVLPTVLGANLNHGTS